MYRINLHFCSLSLAVKVIGLLLFIVLCSVSPGYMYAQTVQGVVIDSTGSPVKNAAITDLQSGLKTQTDRNGKFLLQILPDVFTTIEISHASYYAYTTTVILKPGETRNLTIQLKDISLKRVEVFGKYEGGMERIKPINPGLVPSPTMNFEDLIKTTFIGATGNNELSSQYNVRGGNYDENLIYVNDIEIYRPFLVRAGQQEGLSFIHSDLVEDISFSAGGFEARYGDKLSSVLSIRYRNPVKFAGSVQASFMGGTLHLEGTSKNRRFTWLTGARYRANSYVLGGLQTKGDYKPVFADMQFLTTYWLNEFWKLEVLGHFSSNNYRFVPETRETSFGTISTALKFTVFFEGQEQNIFNTYTGAAAFIHRPNDKMEAKYIISGFRSNESERFDVLGEYLIGELDNNLGSDNFGEVAFNRGVGAFLNHARNELQANLGDLTYRVSYKLNDNHLLHWGARYQYQLINDRLSEWQMIDSAGYSIPQNPADEIQLFEVIKGAARLESHRLQAHVQATYTLLKGDSVKVGDTTIYSNAIMNLAYGVRANWWSYNREVVVSPRVRISYKPRLYYFSNDTLMRRNVEFRFSTGLYYQPPFYREMRYFDGSLNPDIRAQRSVHFVLANDYTFDMWKRPFKFTTELYYKYLDKLIPYEIDNVRIRYYATNNARGYSTGIDFKLNGELVEGVESYIKASVMSTAEDLLDDYYINYFNSDGEKIIFGYTLNDSITDSMRVEPGFIPRPTDQRFNFGIFFQDKMPGIPALTVQLSGLFGTALPFGPSGFERIADTLRTPPYRRVDIGFTYDFLKNRKLREGSKLTYLKSLIFSVEVFNLLGINNTISYTWVKDVEGIQWAIPNFLTPRRINLKIAARF